LRSRKNSSRYLIRDYRSNAAYERAKRGSAMLACNTENLVLSRDKSRGALMTRALLDAALPAIRRMRLFGGNTLRSSLDQMQRRSKELVEFAPASIGGALEKQFPRGRDVLPPAPPSHRGCKFPREEFR
jgi:hypothetical protein